MNITRAELQLMLRVLRDEAKGRVVFDEKYDLILKLEALLEYCGSCDQIGIV